MIRKASSMDLMKKILSTDVKVDEIAIFWLGQAGFLLKNSEGKTLAVDPYLTDCGYKMKEFKAFKRLSPMLIDPVEFNVDYYVTTHLHFDHFDFEAIPVIAQNKQTKFFGPISCFNSYKEMGIQEERIALLEEEKTIDLGGISILPIYADHGEMAPDAVGIYLEMGKHKLYFSGDTAYRPEKIQNVVDLKPDVAILSINGAFGNLNAVEGAKIADLVGAKKVIPCHFWTFKEHGGNLVEFESAVKSLAPNCQMNFMHQGECIILE